MKIYIIQLMFLALVSTLCCNAQLYIKPGSKWTEIYLDTLLHDSWYERVENDGKITYKPNFEIVDYYVKEGSDSSVDECVNPDFIKGYTMHSIYVQKAGRPDSLVCYLLSNPENDIVITAINDINGKKYFAYPSHLYACNQSEFRNVGDYYWFFSIFESQQTEFPRKPDGIIQSKGENYFGGTRLLKYIDLDNGCRIIDNIGVMVWTEKECILGPGEIHVWTVDESLDDRIKYHHRSMLVHFEMSGEVLYHMWPNVNGELEVGIPDVSIFHDARGTYDMQGRPLPREVQRGFYIKDGRKFRKK